MKAIFNGDLLDFNQIQLGMHDRGFRYGDGLFETIAIINKQPRLLDKHFDRVVNGSKILSLDIEEITLKILLENCSRLTKANAIKDYGKLRFTIWRKEGGLYLPLGAQVNYLLTVESTDPPVLNEVDSVGFSEKVVNFPASHSPYKTINALKYVLAALEKKERGLDEIIINDHNGFVSEALESNIFIKKDGVYYTPPVATGCIEGIMRNWLINQLKSNEIPIEERFMIPNEILDAEAIFTTNAMGIKHIRHIQNVAFNADLYVQELIDSIS
jgi:branched-chain amino acid aminotransferase/4-amino-4-deoxychorismate lyase